MLKQIKRQKEGFTIIETMIVLAIAGLIMLIVFLAVPALQRSARNTQRKNDVGGIATAVANYIDNNGGTLPDSTAPSGSSTTNVLIGTGCSTATNSCTGNSETVKLGYYAPGHVVFYPNGPGGTASPAPAANDNISALLSAASVTSTNYQEYVLIVDGYACNSTNTGIGNANTRTAAVLYALEGSGNTYECQEQ